MDSGKRFTTVTALIVALGGFLMGFDASVISGVVGSIEVEFALSKIQLGWSVASLTLTATLGMMVAGPLSDRVGRRPVLKVAAVLFALSAVASALAPDFLTLVLARMLGGFGVGAALIIAPMYIAEIAPSEIRGKMVSFNQLNIVIGISAAFFSNYAIVKLGQTDLAWVETLKLAEWEWRWMLGVETLPAILYFTALMFVPESPRWLMMRGQRDEAETVLQRINGPEAAASELQSIQQSLDQPDTQAGSLKTLFQPAFRLVLTIGITIAVLQQVTGINSVFFYAPMIFEQSGIGTDASFMQAVLVGLVNLVFTIAALMLIDKLGRRPLLAFGLSGITACMLILSYGFYNASYSFNEQQLSQLPESLQELPLQELLGKTYDSDLAFREAVTETIGADAYGRYESDLVSSAISINPGLILFGILGFVACFAISVGPVMWVLFSELFPNHVRGVAISLVGLINSAVSFLVQLVFPWELQNIGNAGTFMIYGILSFFGLVILVRILPETKGRSLEQLEKVLVGS